MGFYQRIHAGALTLSLLIFAPAAALACKGGKSINKAEIETTAIEERAAQDDRGAPVIQMTKIGNPTEKADWVLSASSSTLAKANQIIFRNGTKLTIVFDITKPKDSVPVVEICSREGPLAVSDPDQERFYLDNIPPKVNELIKQAGAVALVFSFNQ